MFKCFLELSSGCEEYIYIVYICVWLHLCLISLPLMFVSKTEVKLNWVLINDIAFYEIMLCSRICNFKFTIGLFLSILVVPVHYDTNSNMMCLLFM